MNWKQTLVCTTCGAFFFAGMAELAHVCHDSVITSIKCAALNQPHTEEQTPSAFSVESNHFEASATATARMLFRPIKL